MLIIAINPQLRKTEFLLNTKIHLNKKNRALDNPAYPSKTSRLKLQNIFAYYIFLSL